MAPYKLSLLLI